jgi:hypothetical protein
MKRGAVRDSKRKRRVKKRSKKRSGRLSEPRNAKKRHSGEKRETSGRNRVADQERDHASIATTAVIAAAVVVAAAKAIVGHPPPDRFLLHHLLLAVVAHRGHHLTAVVRRGHLRGDQPKEGLSAALGETVIGTKRVLIGDVVAVAAKVLGQEVLKRRQKRVYQRKPAV